MNPSVDIDAIKHYCSNHELLRPTINYCKALAFIVSAITLCIIVSGVLCHLTKINFWGIFEVCINVILICFARSVAVFIIHVYQRYAPEEMRRKCKCIPSCSEYALIALDKYIWPIAFYKIWYRVTRTCSKSGYHIDYP